MISHVELIFSSKCFHEKISNGKYRLCCRDNNFKTNLWSKIPKRFVTPLTSLFEEFFAVFAGEGNGAGDVANELYDVSQVVLVPGVLLPGVRLKQVISWNWSSCNYSRTYLCQCTALGVRTERGACKKYGYFSEKSEFWLPQIFSDKDKLPVPPSPFFPEKH